MTIAVYWDVKQQTKQKKHRREEHDDDQIIQRNSSHQIKMIANAKKG